MTSEFFHTISIDCLQLSKEISNKEEDIEVLAMEDWSLEKNDPVCRSLAQALLKCKGYKAIQCYRMAHIVLKSNRKDIAIVIQARCTEVFDKEWYMLIHKYVLVNVYVHVYIYQYMHVYLYI
jgi:hypothetical protein